MTVICQNSVNHETPSKSPVTNKITFLRAIESQKSLIMQKFTTIVQHIIINVWTRHVLAIFLFFLFCIPPNQMWNHGGNKNKTRKNNPHKQHQQQQDNISRSTCALQHILFIFNFQSYFNGYVMRSVPEHYRVPTQTRSKSFILWSKWYQKSVYIIKLIMVLSSDHLHMR